MAFNSHLTNATRGGDDFTSSYMGSATSMSIASGSAALDSNHSESSPITAAYDLSQQTVQADEESGICNQMVESSGTFYTTSALPTCTNFESIGCDAEARETTTSSLVPSQKLQCKFFGKATEPTETDTGDFQRPSKYIHV